MSVKIAVVGATGAVGREMVSDLAESQVEIDAIGFFASQRSAGEHLNFRGKSVKVEVFDSEKVKSYKYVLMSAGGAFSKEYSKTLADAGCVVIDNSSAFRSDEDVPLIVPEVNGDLLRGFSSGVIANPNCSTIQLVCALKPLKDSFGLESVFVSTYQSVSGSGQKGIKELSSQMGQFMKFEELTPKHYEQPIAFNVLPAIDTLDADEHCFEEIKMINETRRLLSLEHLPVLAQAVRVPVFNCHCESVMVRLAEKTDIKRAKDSLREAPGVELVDGGGHSSLPTPHSVTGRPDVYVCRVRLPYGEKLSNWLQFWNVADNLKKGAATNAVQILESVLSGAHDEKS